MPDTAKFGLDAPMRPEFMKAAQEVIMTVLVNRTHSRPKAILGEWLLAGRVRAHEKFGYNMVWTATHIKNGVVVAFVGDRLITFEGSLPRLIFGNNTREINSQASLTGALMFLAKTVGTIADIHDVLHHAKLKRLDLVAYADVPLSILKRSLRYATHPCTKSGPLIYANSLHYKGDNVQVFIYDKDKKNRTSDAGTRSRIEVRLMTKEAITRYPNIHVGGPQLDYSEAMKAYRTILGQLPNEGKIIQVPAQSIYGFLAWTEEAVSEACSPRPVEVYCDMCCDNNDSKNRTRRLVAAVAPTILESRLTDRLSIQASASDSHATPYHHWEWWKAPYVFTLNRDHPKCDHAESGRISS